MMISQTVSERNGWRLLSKSRCERKGLQSSKGATMPSQGFPSNPLSFAEEENNEWKNLLSSVMSNENSKHLTYISCNSQETNKDI